MNELYGFTRDIIKARYALRTPAGFVPSRLPGWTGAAGVVQISEGMGARFCQIAVNFEPGGEGRGNTGPIEYLVYVMAGECRVELEGQSRILIPGGFAYVPPGHDFQFSDPKGGGRLLIFQKKFETLAGARAPGVILGNEHEVAGQPFLGNPDTRLQTLLPDQPEFDMAVNVFTFQPGATLPFV